MEFPILLAASSVNPAEITRFKAVHIKLGDLLHPFPDIPAQQSGAFASVLLAVAESSGKRLEFFGRFFGKLEVAGITAHNAQSVNQAPQEQVALVQNAIFAVSYDIQA